MIAFITIPLVAFLLDPGIFIWHAFIDDARLIVAGEVVDFGQDADGRRTAILRVDLVLKGECKEKRLVLPFKEKLRHACDLPITYEKRKYLLLLDDREFFRLVDRNWGPKIEIADLDVAEIRFTRAVVDIRAGAEVEKRLRDLEKLLGERATGLEKLHMDEGVMKQAVLDFARSLPRTIVRPLLPGIRKACGARFREEFTRATPADRVYVASRALDYTLDLAWVTELRDANMTAPPWPLQFLQRATGKSFRKGDEFWAWWDRSVERVGKDTPPNRAIEFLERLGPDANSEAILDLGPGILEEIRKRPRWASLVPELELLRDLRDDLKK